ncbi:hypothetical protein C2S52_009255 [Perilla frutescens var. hirtella]|nr:hypothetical protein C2S52_009255 [Perilla frutescens var. hirtella]
MSNKDVENEAQALYGKTKFTHHEVFKQVMRQQPRWELILEDGSSRKHPDNNNEEEDRGSSKRSRTDEDGSDPIEVTPISCPIGRDKARGKRKGKATTSQSSSISDEFTAELHAMRLTREQEIETAKRKIDVVTLTTLSNNRDLNPEEDDLKRRLMAKLYPHD